MHFSKILKRAHVFSFFQTEREEKLLLIGKVILKDIDDTLYRNFEA
jgi:hypothetical protein